MAISAWARRISARTALRGDGRSAARSPAAIGYEDLHRNQRVKRVARQIDAKKTPQQILDEAEKDHPPAGKLLQAFRDVLGGLRDFIVAHHIVTIPSTIMPIIEETPPFERALLTASMDTPGAYEKVATEAFFNVTLPEPGLKPAI